MKVVDRLPEIPALQPIISDLQSTAQFINEMYPDDTVTVDLSISSPQQYYTGMAFEALPSSQPTTCLAAVAMTTY